MTVKTKIRLSVLFTLLVGALYIAVVGINIGFEYGSNFNLVSFSDKKYIKSIDESFQPFQGVTVQIIYNNSRRIEENKKRYEIDLFINFSGDYYKTWTNSSEPRNIGSKSHFKQMLRKKLIQLTGDPNVQILELTCPYLGP